MMLVNPMLYRRLYRIVYLLLYRRVLFKGSTEHVVQHAIPQLIKMDGLLLPSEINFKV